MANNTHELELDLNSRDYDVDSICEDKRFVRCKKEMFMVMIIAAIQIIIPTILIYTLNGNGKYFLGYPMWYGVTFLFYLCNAAFCIVFAFKVIKRHKLAAIADDEEEN